MSAELRREEGSLNHSRHTTDHQDRQIENVNHLHLDRTTREEYEQAMAVTGVKTCTCQIKIEGTDAFVLVDTGSMVTIVHPAITKHCGEPITGKPTRTLLRSASGHKMTVSHEVDLRFTFGKETRKHPALICPDLLQDAIIGFDFIRQHNLEINAQDLSIRLASSGRIPLRAAEQWQSDQAGLSVVQASSSKGELPRKDSRKDETKKEGVEEEANHGASTQKAKGMPQRKDLREEDTTEESVEEEADQEASQVKAKERLPRKELREEEAKEECAAEEVNQGAGTLKAEEELSAKETRTDDEKKEYVEREANQRTGERKATHELNSIDNYLGRQLHRHPPGEDETGGEITKPDQEDNAGQTTVPLPMTEPEKETGRGHPHQVPPWQGTQADPHPQQSQVWKDQTQQKGTRPPKVNIMDTSSSGEAASGTTGRAGEPTAEERAGISAISAQEHNTTKETDQPSPESGPTSPETMQGTKTRIPEPTDQPSKSSPDASRTDKKDIRIGPVSPSERQRLLELVGNYPECFAWNGELGKCGLIEHHIELTTNVPVRRPAYKVAHADREFIEKEVREMLAKDVIEPSVSPYAAGVVLVPKKSGETRFCVDYRGLNQVTRADHYPLPLARSEIFDTLGEAKIFSCLDCQQGYWQVSVAEEDRHKTAFRCFLGLFQFKRVPFGLKTAPSTYQRLMAHILSGYTGKFCHCFIDDIIVFSNTFEDHLEHLRLVLLRLKNAGIKLKPSKCVLAKEKVQYLGHTISPGEIRPDPENVSKIRDLDAPTTVKQVRTLLGMASYYRCFVRDFSKRARLLTELTRQDIKFRWGEEEESAFEDLKKALTTEPVLTLPDFTKPFILMTDGSSTGLGAVLGQQHDGESRERVISYASRRTNRLEESYSACELECLALVWATRHFREYILGRTTEVITDHWALKWLQDLKNPNPRLQRWRIALQEFDLIISHKPGKQHRNADFLSRMYEDEHRREKEGKKTRGAVDQQDQEDVRQVAAVITRSMTKREREETTVEEERGPHESTSWRGKGAPPPNAEGDMRPSQTRRQNLANLQKEDKDCLELRQAVERGHPVPGWAKQHTFRLSTDGVLERVSVSRHGEEQHQIVLPRPLQKSAVQDAHAGHLKVGKTLGNLRRSFFFRNMYTVCTDYISGCPQCQQKDRGRKLQAPLGNMPKPLGAWHTVAVDVLGPLPQTRTGKKYIVVVTDYLTRFVITIATKDQTAETTADALMEKFLEFGLPERLITDNGPNFRSRLLAEMCRLIRTAHMFTTPYHPQFDGLCERFNRTLASMLRGFVGQHQRDWDQYLPYVMHAYRAAPQESTGETPFFLMFGRPSRAPLNLWLEPTRLDLPNAAQQVGHTKPHTVARMHTAFQTVQARLQEAHERQKRNHDKTSKERRFQVGDEVLLLDERVGEGQTKKLHPPWKPGYRVIEIVGPLNYKIEHPSRRGRILRVHVNRLKAQKPEYVWPEESTEPGLVSDQPSSAGQRARQWLEREAARHRPPPRDHSPVSDSSDEEGVEEQPTRNASEPHPDPLPQPADPDPGNREGTRRRVGRPRLTARTSPTRPRPFETPTVRRSERIRRRRDASM